MTGPWIDAANLAMGAAALMLALLGLVLVRLSRSLSAWSRRFFFQFFLVLALYDLSNLAEQVLYIAQDSPLVSQLSLFLESLFSSLLLPLLTLHLLRYCGQRLRTSPVMHLVLGIWLVYFVLLVVTQFTTWIYYYTPDNVYHRGPWYPVLLMPPVAISLVNLITLFRYRGRLSSRQFTAFLIYPLAPLLAMVVQMFVYGLYLIVIGSTVSALFMFVFLLSDQMDSYVRQQEEIARQRASILVLQMRPHFIYNTMTSIYYLCGQDPARAQQVILDFTSYLRKNLTAIARKDTIPFAEELEHTQAYLAVEQVRFEGQLSVIVDTPHTRFRLPPLTLQPIVENAVKHGVDPELSPLHIVIRTRAAGNGSEILVEDDGPGFNAADSDDPHIALRNIRERLELMCGGRLTIRPRPEGGTAVTITVPDRA